MQTQIDYISTVQFMWYNREWIPRQVVFAGIYDPNEHYSVQPSAVSLKRFSYLDVLKNCRLPNNPFNIIPEVGLQIEKPFDDLAHFLGHEFYNTILKNDSGWDVHIGTLDMAAFLYLEPLLPEGTVHFIGSDIMKNCLHLMGPVPDAGHIARMAALTMQSQHNKDDQEWSS